MHIGERVGNPTVNKRQADGTQVDNPCPPCLPDYQKYMRGVDRGDQLERVTIMLAENQGRGGGKFFSFVWKFAFLNSFCMEKMVGNINSEVEKREICCRLG